MALIMLAGLSLFSTPSRAVTGFWTLDGSSNWINPANWQGGVVPNNVGDIANFNFNITGARTVTLDAPITLGGLIIGDTLGASAYTFAGPNALTFDAAAGNAFINKYNSVTDVWQAPITLNDNLDANIYAGTLDVTGAGNAQVVLTSAASGIIKNGAGTLRLNVDSTAYTGDWTMNLGTLNIGGANSATPGSLGNGTGGITLNGSGIASLTVFSLNNNGIISNGTINYTGNNNVNLRGAATINVDRNYIGGANTGNTMILGNLNFGGGTLSVTSANSYALRFDGTTTLAGETNIFSVGANTTANLPNLTLGGVITDGAGSRALIKEGAGRMVVVSGANTYDGGTVVKDGFLQLGAGANLGTGKVFVNGGVLSLADAAQATTAAPGGIELISQIGTSRAALAVVGNTGYSIDAATPLNVTVPIYGMVLGIDGNFANNIDISQIGGAGNTRVSIANVGGADRTYTGTITPATDNVIRMNSAANTLILTTANTLGGAGSTAGLVFGLDYANPLVFSGVNITQGNTGTVSVRANNDVTLGAVTLNRGITVNINGAITTPLGNGVVTALGGTISTDNASAAQFANTDFRLFGGSTLLLDNGAVTTANTDRRLLPATNLDLTSSTLRLIGDGGAATVASQTVASIDYFGGSTISVDTDAAIAGRLTTLTTGTLNRGTTRGTLNIRNISNTATTFGTAVGTQKLIVTAAPVVTNGMIGANIALWAGANSNDPLDTRFATYDATHGVQAAAFTLSGATADTAAELAAAAATAIVSVDAATFTGPVTTASVQALRVRTTAAAGASQVLTGGTITIGASAAIGQGAGLHLEHTVADTVTHSTNFAFGTQEGLIYAGTTGAGVITLSGVISGTNGVTRFGDGVLVLSGANTFTGPLTINSGETRINNIRGAGPLTGTPNNIELWGGSAYLNLATQRVNNNVTFFNDARFGNVNIANTGFNNITVEPRTNSTAPIVLDIRNQAGANSNIAYGGLTLNGSAEAYITHILQVNGAISGTGALEKFGNERLFIGGNSSGYSQPVTVNTGGIYSLNATAAAKPFGTGQITINPGGALRIAAPTNINAGQLVMNSDDGGISMLAMSYVGDPTALPALGVNSSAPWRGALGISAVGFSANIDQSTLFGGGTYLGAPVGDTGVFTGTLTPSGGNYLLGTGQGLIRIERPLTGANSAEIGVSMTGGQSQETQIVNNSGGVVQYDVPMTYTGSTRINPASILRVHTPNTLTATGGIILNGGQLRGDTNTGQLRFNAPLVISNAITMTGDSTIQLENAQSDLILSGTLSLAPGSNGVVRTLTVGVDGVNAGNLIMDGTVIDGAGGSGNHLVKAGYGTLFLRAGNLQHTGTTTITGGLLGVNSDSDFGTTSQLIFAGGGIGVFENSFTSSRNITFTTTTNGWFDVTPGLTFTQGATSTYDGANFLMKRGMGTVVLNGNNAQAGIWIGDGVLQVNSQAALGDPARVGVADIQFGGDFSPGAGTATRHLGGTLRINADVITTRGVTFNNNGSTNYAGGLDVTGTNTFTVAGVMAQGTEFDYGFKTGTGTLITTGANTMRQFAVVNGTMQFSNSTPWANSTATAADNTNIEMIGGTIHAMNAGADILLANLASTTNYNYGGGGHLRTTSGAGFEASLNADNLLRQNQGTLVLETGAGTLLGGAVNSNSGQVIVTSAINAGVARASATTNGIYAAHLIGADSAGTAFFLQNNVTTGFEAYSGATTATLSGLNPTGIGDIIGAQVLAGNNSIYAFRTTANVSGGTLRIGAIDNLREGGILFNGSNTISSSLIFDPTSATAPGTGTVGEGLVYVKEGESAVISGNITSNALTKFGKGTLTISGTNLVAGDVSVQDGTLRLGGNSALSRMNSELNLNAGATLDMNGFSASVETLGANNRLVDTATVAGRVINSSGTQSTLSVASPITNATSFPGTINGNLKLVKSGAGVLNIDGYRSNAPDAGNNTFTGGTDIYGVNIVGGINLQSAPFGLGGADSTTPGDVNLYSGTLGLLFGGFIATGSAPMYNNLTIKFGNQATNGYTVNVKGNTAINVDRGTFGAAGLGNLMQIGDLNIGNQILQFSGANTYRLKVAGTTTIQGPQATFQFNSDSTGIQLDGLVTGAGALNKTGDATLRTLTLTNPGNNYSGGTNIIGGDLQVTTAGATTLGTGAVRIFPEGTLRIAGNASVTGANLQTLSRVNSLAAVVLDNNFNPSVLTTANFSSVYNTTLQLGQQMWSQPLNMAAIGDGRAFLGNGLNTTVNYIAPTLGAGVADAWNPGVGVYRVVGGGTTFSFDGPNDVFTGSAYMQVGPQRNSAIGVVTNTGNFVSIRNSNTYSGGTQITEGSNVLIETGGSTVAETPLGTGAVEVYGELRVRGPLGSLYNNTTGLNSVDVVMRPGGLLRLTGESGITIAPQGQWGDAVALDLNGGRLRLEGAAAFQTNEVMGALTVRKGSGLEIVRNNTATSAQLSLASMIRTPAGTLTLAYNAGFLGINTTTPDSYERITVGGGVAVAGTTTNGAGVTNPGIAPVWIVDATTNSYVGYNPTVANTGFQPLLGAAPGAGEIAYNKIVTGALTAGGLVAGDIADLTTAAKTLADNPTLHAMRFNQNISPTAGNNTMTLTSGGFINTGTPTINPTGAITAGVVSPMTINFGAGGAGEAIVFNAGNMIMQAQMVAAQGLTKFGGSNFEVRSINPGIGGAVTVNAGALVVRVPVSGSGAAVSGVFNNQDIILNGGQLVMQGFLSNASGTASEIASNINAMGNIGGNVFVRGDANITNNNNALSTRINNLTIDNGGGATALNGNGVISLGLFSGVNVMGTTTLGTGAVINGQFQNFSTHTLFGPVVGSALVKYGNGATILANAANIYSGGTIINGSSVATAASTVGSAIRTGTPFGTGAITVNPGGNLRIAENTNISGNAVTLKSDGIGLAGLSLAHNGALPTIITAGVPAAGQVKIESTGPFGGMLGLDYGYYSQDINLASIGNGDWWLGNSTQAETFYFNDTLGANSNGRYQLGGGGAQNGINFGSVLVSGGRTSLFENIFTGGTAGQTRVEVGALTADLFANGPSFVNGNGTNMVMVSRNTTLVGDTRVNTNTTLAIGNNFALGNGRLVLNGGIVRYDFGPNNAVTSNVTLDSNVLLQGDFSTTSGNELVINGNVAMHDGTAGATRVWNLGGTGAMAVRGVISGNDGSNLIKLGGQVVTFSGVNTYQGYTQIGQGTIVVVGDVLPGVNGPLGNSTSPIVLASGAANVGGGIGIGGKYTIARDIQVSQATGTGTALIEARTNEIAKITGGISIITGGVLTLGAVAADVSTFRGGTLDVQGPISGAGSVLIGTTAVAPGNGGTVLLSASSNGYGTNTFSGGTTLNSARLQIASDTYFSGPATNPTILSGPLGTGTFTFGVGEANRGGTIEAVGGPRVIVNALGAIATAANTTASFSGREALTFTRDLNLNSDGTMRVRTMNVTNFYQPVTFSGALTNSGAGGSNLVKTGAGLLLLTGTNTNANLLTTDAAYGSAMIIDAGILRVNSNAALGSTTAIAAGGQHVAGTTADLWLRSANNAAGGTLSVSNSFSTPRQIILGTTSTGTTNGITAGIDVASGQTFTLTSAIIRQTGTVAVSNASLIKTGPGTLALDNIGNLHTNLILGGQQQLNPTAGLFSHTGGTVSTIAASGTPFGTYGTTALAAGATTAGSTSVTVTSTTGVIPGMILTGAGIPEGATVVSVTSGTVLVISTPATATATALALNARGAATIHSGSLSLIGGAAPQALSIPALLYGAAGQVGLNQGTTTSQLTVSQLLARGNSFNSISYGTLTINPSALANLGSTEKLIVTTGAPANTTLAGGDILTVPSIFVALAGAGQNANFARYDAVNGLREHNVTTIATLAASAAMNVGDILAADIAGAGNIDIGALRTAANIAPTDGTTLIRINNGGLIFNGAAPSTISANTLFGTGTGASLREAIVYVRDGQGGASAISGNVTALDFTKTGPGSLELSGATNQLNPNVGTRQPVLSVQNGAFRFATTAAQFTNSLRPADVISRTGSYTLNVNEAGIFDLNAITSTAVGGLTGNGTITNNNDAATANLRVTNGFGVDPTFSGSITNGTGAVRVTKSGDGIQIFAGHSTYTGGTIIEAGRVTNATGSAAANGTLDARRLTALGAGPVTLAGGTLAINNNFAHAEVEDGVDFNTFGPGNGYDLVIQAVGLSNGIALTNNISSIISINSSNTAPAIGVSNTGINSLTINAPMLTITGAATAANIGLLLVKGATNINQDTVIRTTTGRLFLAGQVNAPGLTITKTGFNGTAGVGELVLTHTEGGAAQNDVGLWKIYGGIINPRAADGAANPLGLNPTVEINGGSTNYGLLLSTDGDGTAATERVTTYANTNLRFGSMLPVSSNEFVASGAGRIATDRILANNDDKTVVVNTLQVGGVLGSAYVLTTGGSGDNLWVNGATTFTRDMYLQNDLALTLNGLISGNGTFVKRAGGNLFVNADNSVIGGYKGGTVLGAGGTTYLGSLDGNQVTLSDTAKLGGQVIINPASRLLINGVGNVATGQTFSVGGNLNNYGVLGIGSNMTLQAVGYRALGLGGIQNSAANYYTSASNPSASVLAINTVYTQQLDQLSLGDGMGYIGSTTNGVGANGLYDAAKLLPGLNDTFRLGAGGATLFIGLSNANVLSNMDATCLTNLIVGAPMSVENNNVIGNGSGTIVLLSSNNYGGTTWINRNSTLDFRGTLATSSIETYGVLNVAGEAGTFIGAGAVTLRPGSTLRFDNTSAGVMPVAATQGRWADATVVALNNSTVRMQGNAALETQETVGGITTQGGSFIELARGVIGRGTELRTPSISRVSGGTVQLNHTTAQLGTDERLLIAGGPTPTVTNGMVAPWMVSNTDVQFLTYNADTGYTLAGFDRNQAAATLAATVSGPTERLLVSGNVVLNTGIDLEAYAMRLSANVTVATATDPTAQLIIGSGGLIIEGARAVTTGIQAGAGASELLLYNNATFTLGDTTAANRAFQGQLSASSITKFGGGQLSLNSEQQTFTGDIRVQGGSLVLRYVTTAALPETNPNSRAGGNGGTIFMEGPNTTLFLRGGADGLTGNVGFNNSVTIGDYNPIVQFDSDRQATNISNRRNIINNNFTFGLNNAETGQIARFVGANTYDFQLGSDATDLLTLNGKSVFQVEAAGQDVFVAAKTTGTGQLVKSQAGLLQLANVTNLNDWSGGTTVMNGTFQVFARSPNVANLASSNLTAGGLGTGDATLTGGALDLRLDTDNGADKSGTFGRSGTTVTVTSTAHGYANGQVVNVTVGPETGTFVIANVAANTFTYTSLSTGTIATGTPFASNGPDANLERVRYSSIGNGPNLIIAGSSTLNLDRTGLVAAGANKQIGFNNLTIGSQILTVTGGNGYGAEITGTTTMQGNMFLNNTTDFVLNGAIDAGGGAPVINKIGTGVLWINNTNPGLVGPTFINGGILDWGDRLTGNTTAKLGTGDIFVNPNGAIRIRGVGNLNTGLGQEVVLTSTPYSSALLRTVASFTQAQLQSFIQPRTTTSNEVTYISFEAALGANNLDQSLIGDGCIYFGAVGDRTYTGSAVGSSLLPGLPNHPNAVVGGTSTNPVYRLGHNSGNTLIINLTEAGAGLGDVGGSTDVQVGSLATLGQTNYNTGFVYFQDQNTYTGQTVVSRGLTLRFNTAMAAGDTAGPLGVGSAGAALIDVYGGLRSESGSSFQNTALTANFYTNIKLHPGSALSFQDMAAGGDRWENSTPINLDGATIVSEAVNNADNGSETIGALTFDRGARINPTSEGTGDSFLTVASVTRATASAGAGTGRGTLVINPTATAVLGAAATAGVAQTQVIFSTAPASASSAVPDMLPGYYIDGNGHRFLSHNATTGVVPVADGTMVPFTAGMTAGTAVVNVTAATTLPDFNPVIYGLRGGAFTLNSPTGANNDATITFAGSGADIGAVVSSGAFVINPNLKFGATGTNEALFYAGGGIITLNGNLTAGSVTKFGTNQLVIANDQSDAARGTGQGYSGGWFVNEGSLTLNTFGSAGNTGTILAPNAIVLNGNQSSTATLFLRAQPADTLLNYTYTSGKIIAVDTATIDWDPGADDRVHTIADIEIQQSGGIGNATANGTVDAQLRIVNVRSRSILAAGQLTITNNAILNVDATNTPNTFIGVSNNAANLTNGGSNGMSVASLNGTERLTKWGDGYLYVRGASPTFSGTMVIDQGAVQVTHNQSLGSGALTVNRYGVLDIGVANFVATNSSVTMNEGSVERWSVDGARTGSVNLGKGSLQVGADQTGTVNVVLNGGTIEGWLRTDDITATSTDTGVFRNLGPNVSVTLAGNSTVGNPYYLGTNGLDSGRQTNDNRPTNDNIGTGATLNIQGVISGSSSITKVGYDTVILSGANTYDGGTLVSGGTLKLGRNDALAANGNVTTNSNGVLDLNGNNQTVAQLSNPVNLPSPTVTSGFVTNSAAQTNTLTVGNGVASNFTYSGIIQHNVAVTKTGSAVFTLDNANTYKGKTDITAGTVKLGVTASIDDSLWIDINSGTTLDVAAKGAGGYTFDGKISGGGTDAAGTTFATVTNSARISGTLIIGDHVGEVCTIGTLSPGGSSNPLDVSTGGNLIGHIYTDSALTLSGALIGSSPSLPVSRLTMQLNGSTTTLASLGYTTGDMAAFIDGLTGLEPALNGGAGNLANHDYINVGGALTLTQNGRIDVAYFGAYTPVLGDVFNLFDWGSLTNNAFNVGARNQDGTENNDLNLPTLSDSSWKWDTSRFASQGMLAVVTIIPEPSRAMLLLIALCGVMLRRRRLS